MKYQYSMTKNPNQRFNTNIANSNFEFEFRTFRGVMYANVKIDGVISDLNVVCVPNRSLFNSTVNLAAGGTFSFVSLKEDYVNSDDFDGITTMFVFEKDE